MDISTIGPLLPEIIMAASALLVLLVELVIRKKETAGLLSIIAVAIVAYYIPQSFGKAFGGMFISDGYSVFFKFIFFINLILTVLLSMRYLVIEKANHGEYYALIMFSTLGMMIMASAGDLIVLYLGLELMALSTYILAGFIRHDIRSNEAALKYFLLGAFSSALLLYGITMIYGLTGTTDISLIGAAVAEKGLSTPMFLSIIFLMVAFGFKIALAPFHMWAPDVYEGAPTSITAFMSVGPKAAGFAAFGRVFLTGFGPLSADWTGILIVLSILTMAVGNIIAIQQSNIKRMLAYSSVAHAGYAVLGIIVGGTEGIGAMMNYLFIYGFMNIGAFAVVIMLRSEGFQGEALEDYKGLARTHPLAAAMMLIFMFSLTGIPPTAGFIGKFYLFKAVIGAGYIWLAVVAVIFSAISAYFYLRVVMYMYMLEPEGEAVTLSLSPSLGLALLITTLVVIFIGIYPSPLLSFARLAAG
ncbi:NADH-quinone oxidoreductase subunit N [bacterium BMS3Bbin07]|nr:NADH-quinone oxidoreductase subunit N [bacterium BMS3Bbin07]HDH02536.1 NADH-quinone oxidoreductase subunit N [Nitrospirota bacterium]